MKNARWDEVQAGIKMARRNINKLSDAGDADNTILMAESEEKLKSLLMRKRGNDIFKSLCFS